MRPFADGRSPLPHALAAAALALAVLAAFGGALANGFVSWDDNLYIYANPHIRALTAENLRWMFANRFPQWGPLAFLWHALDYALFGLAPAGHHLTSLLLHAANAGLVMALFLALGRAASGRRSEAALLAGGFAAALLFAVHPLRVESVAWASEKKDLLSALFYLAALLAWLRRASAQTARGRGAALALTHLFMILSLLTKAMAVTLPAVLLLLDLYPLRRLSLATLPRLLAEKLLLIALALAAATFTLHEPLDAPPPVEYAPPPAGGSVFSNLSLALPTRAAAFYIRKSVWPARLAPFYPLPPRDQLTPRDPEFLRSALLLLALTGLAGWSWHRGRAWAALALAFYLVTLLPVSGVTWLSGQIASDRFTYLPTLAFYLLAGAGLAAAQERGGWARWAYGAAVALAAVLLIGATRSQVRIWKDSWVFWTYEAEMFPGVVMAHNNLGALHHERALATGDPAELALAEAEYRKVLELFPQHANAYNNLGLIYEQRGDLANAEGYYRKALALAPGHPLAQANLARLKHKASPR